MRNQSIVIPGNIRKKCNFFRRNYGMPVNETAPDWIPATKAIVDKKIHLQAFPIRKDFCILDIEQNT